MNFHYKRLLLSAAIILAAINLHATTRKVLFIGNSYTFTNNMPLMLQTLAATLGDTLVYEESDPGGFTLEEHSTYAPTISLIFSQPWDIVVLQEQSELPAFPPSQVDTQVYPYAHILDSMIHANDSCTQTMFLMTWGHADGDPPNCPIYPPICTYDGMQQSLRQSYMQMTQDNKAIVAPVGAAWEVMRDSFPAIWLYQSDSDHPVVPGSYLEACVLYSSIFHKQTYGCTYSDGLTTSDAEIIQHVADKVTLDSLTQWQQYGHYPYAGFNYTEAGSTVTFSYVPTIASGYVWSFGDGAHDTTAVPLHTYTASGKYQVSHTAATNCFSETITDTILINAVNGIGNPIKEDTYPVNAIQKGNGNITFLLPAVPVYNTLEVSDANGRCIRRYTITGSSITDNFVPGFYIYRAFSLDNGMLYYNKLIVY